MPRAREGLTPWPLQALLVALAVLIPRLAWARLGVAEKLTAKTFDSFVQNNQKVLVDFFDSADPQWHANQQDFQTAARSLRQAGHKVPLAMVDSKVDEALAKKYVPNKVFPQFVWFLNGQASQYHRSLRTLEQIVAFVEALDRDPLMEIKTEDDVFEFNPAVLAKLTKGSPLRKVMEVVASKHMDTVGFVALDTSGPDNVTFVAKDHPRDQYSGEANVEQLERWVREMLVRSEEKPNGEEAQDGASEVVVGSTFEEKVKRPDKDVMLLVHAPWCGFCRKFMPVWDEFARKVSGIEHLVVAKMDGDRNSSPDPDNFAWAMFPTILFLRAGESTPEIFKSSQKERTVDSLVAFVREHSSKPIGKVDMEL